MSAIISIASDFIDRMSNPAHGTMVNEDYALRFATLMASDDFEGKLRSEANLLYDCDALTPHGWLWLLGWARAHEVSLNDDLLLKLIEKWSSIFIQVLAIDVATRNIQWTRSERPVHLEGFHNTFLRKLLASATQESWQEPMEEQRARRDDQARIDRRDVRTDRAETLLVALLQVGSEIAIDAARTLLNHHWRGEEMLKDFYFRLKAGLEEETQQAWDSRLRPPGSPER